MFFQIQDKDQDPLFRACAKLLVEEGYRVPNRAELVDVPLKANDVRYFFEEEAPEAQAVRDILSGCLKSRVRVRHIKGYEGSSLVKHHQFEVWFTSGEG